MLELYARSRWIQKNKIYYWCKFRLRPHLAPSAKTFLKISKKRTENLNLLVVKKSNYFIQLFFGLEIRAGSVISSSAKPITNNQLFCRFPHSTIVVTFPSEGA